MRPFLFVAVFTIATLTGCATTGAQVAADGKQMLEKATLCCTTLKDAASLPLPVEKQELRIDGTHQAFLFSGAKSFFVLYRLPEFKGTYSILLSSNSKGTVNDTAIFLPRVTTYDASFKLIPYFDESTLRSRGSTMEWTIFINPSNAAERYIAIHVSDLSATMERTFSMQTFQQVHVRTGFDEDILGLGEPGQVCFRGSIAAQLVSFDLDEDFIQMPGCISCWSHLLHTVGKLLAELVASPSDRLVADYHPALQQHFDMSQAELETEIPAHRATDDCTGESKAIVKGLGLSSLPDFTSVYR